MANKPQKPTVAPTSTENSDEKKLDANKKVLSPTTRTVTIRAKTVRSMSMSDQIRSTTSAKDSGPGDKVE